MSAIYLAKGALEKGLVDALSDTYGGEVGAMAELGFIAAELESWASRHVDWGKFSGVWCYDVVESTLPGLLIKHFEANGSLPCGDGLHKIFESAIKLSDEAYALRYTPLSPAVDFGDASEIRRLGDAIVDAWESDDPACDIGEATQAAVDRWKAHFNPQETPCPNNPI